MLGGTDILSMRNFGKGGNTMNVTIASGCIACGLCAATCPAVFQLGESGEAEIYTEPTPADADAIREAAQGCPVSVILVED